MLVREDVKEIYYKNFIDYKMHAFLFHVLFNKVDYKMLAQGPRSSGTQVPPRGTPIRRTDPVRVFVGPEEAHNSNLPMRYRPHRTLANTIASI